MDTLDSIPKTLLSDPKKRRAWVIYLVSIQGRSLAAIARDAGVTRQTIYRVFNTPNPPMEKLIADAIGLTPQQLFPERYKSEGQPTAPAECPENCTPN